MPQLQIFAHLPRFRMEPDHVEFPVGDLVKLTWESYDSMTLGAFSDWKPRFEAADPVFLHIESDADVPFVRPGVVEQASMAELKIPSIQWGQLFPRMIGSTFLTQVHDHLVDHVWSALLLAVPGAAPAWPRTSVTIVLPDEGHVITFGDDEPRMGLKVQGEADQEYVYSVDTACVPLTEDELVLAAHLVPIVRRIATEAGHAPLAAAMRQLMAATDAALGPEDRLVFAVTALEALLLTGVHTGQQDAFAQRVTALLGEELEETARAAYRARSRAVHEGAAGGRDLPATVAEQLLADVIIASGAEPGEIDRPDPTGPRGWAPDQRLLPRPAWFSATSTSGVNLSAPDGHTVSWSPLIGLDYDGPPVATACGAVLMPFSVEEIVSMEEKDIRRDFIAQLRTDDTSVAGLAVTAETGDQHGLDDDLMRRLFRPRDLSVAGLRLAGLDDFTDPELLGWYAYQDTMRHRRETVLRQSVLMKLGAGEGVPLEGAALAAAHDAWSLLAAYDGRGSHPDVELLLGQLRRAHDPFLAEEARMTLLFAVLEGMLGRFRPTKDPVQLEDLVSVVAGLDPGAAQWCSAHARRVRNEHAHGAWDPSDDERAEVLPSLRATCAAALRDLLGVWDGSGDPSLALVNELEARLEAAG